MKKLTVGQLKKIMGKATLMVTAEK